jgi:hypothetical protein
VGSEASERECALACLLQLQPRPGASPRSALSASCFACVLCRRVVVFASQAATISLPSGAVAPGCLRYKEG